MLVMLLLVQSGAFRLVEALQNVQTGSPNIAMRVAGNACTLSLSNASLTGFDGWAAGAGGVVDGGGDVSAIVYQATTVLIYSLESAVISLHSGRRIGRVSGENKLFACLSIVARIFFQERSSGFGKIKNPNLHLICASLAKVFVCAPMRYATPQGSAKMVIRSRESQVA